jgi:putative nucleotidyltransferase with HDIG domain
MSVAEELGVSNAESLAAVVPSTPSPEFQAMLERAYGAQFTILDGQTAKVLWAAPDQPAHDWQSRAEVCRAVARRGRPEFIDDEDPLLTLALPLCDAAGATVVAVATFLTRSLEPIEDLCRQSELLGMRPRDALAWARRQKPWSTAVLKRIGDFVCDGTNAKRRVTRLRQEADSLSSHIASTYDEISLLYRLTQNLKLSKSNEELGRIALQWTKDVMPAGGLVLQLAPGSGGEESLAHVAGSQPVLLTCGECPIGGAEFAELMAYLVPNGQRQPMMIHRSVTAQPDWPCPQIHEMIAVPLYDSGHAFGWVAALNHADGGEFGSADASLLGSVAAVLGIHGGNVELYRQRSELLVEIVRALTSAVDAKDPYTCGHSDRVARVSVRLAEELGCDAAAIDNLYLAGLLHDIGKIGIDDSVLRKAGTLSDAEYEHIKAHVSIGHRMLHDLAKLEDVLPVVLHHHESWDGGGYPYHLDAQQIPLSARIVAVADAFDAMSSDRPYRKAMPDETVDRILETGAGQQWDPDVVRAFFRARQDIRRLCREQRQPVDLELTRFHG